MPPNQQPQQVPQTQTPQQPNVDFTQTTPPQQIQQPQPVQPVQQDSSLDEIKKSIAEIGEKVNQFQQPQQPVQTPQQQESQKKYDEWGAPDKPGTVFGDVAQLVEQKFQEQNQKQTEAQKAAAEQEQQNQQQIDATFNSLRQANYLPAVNNPLDENDPGKQAEYELIGYALNLGTTDLVAAARNLHREHQRGSYYDYKNKKLVDSQTQQPQQPNIFGNVPNSPDQTPQNPAPYAQPNVPQAPVGPSNPYMTPQYPAGFNAPVSTGNASVNMGGQAPNLQTLRNMNYDDIVNTFNRTQ